MYKQVNITLMEKSFFKKLDRKIVTRTPAQIEPEII